MQDRPDAGEFLDAIDTGTHVEFAERYGANLAGISPEQIKEILKLACLVGQPFVDAICPLIVNS